MVRKVHVEGYDALQKALKANEGSTVFVLFAASKGPNGLSWCDDCNTAHPVIEECLCSAPACSVLIECGVGDKCCWKDQCNIFRQQLSIKCVPTLMNWGKKWKKLEEEQCANKGLVTMFFTDN